MLYLWRNEETGDTMTVMRSMAQCGDGPTEQEIQDEFGTQIAGNWVREFTAPNVTRASFLDSHRRPEMTRHREMRAIQRAAADGDTAAKAEAQIVKTTDSNKFRR